MNTLATALLVLAMVAALADWIAVSRDLRPLEYVAKPATLTFLVALAAVLTPSDDAQRWWFVIALAFCLAGDVFLMFPERYFLAGVVAFLLGHVGYIVGFLVRGVELGIVAIAGAVVLMITTLVGRVVVKALRTKDPRLAGPIVVYMTVISAMVAAAFGERELLAAAGATLFFVSDAHIAWHRFVRSLSWAPLTIIVTYHVGQALLVLSLV